MSGGDARIGPNAILQLLPVLDRQLGAAGRDDLLRTAGIDTLPDGTSMIDETPVARLHQALRRHEPAIAPGVARAAGAATGDYILAHRIPQPAKRLLTLLPSPLSARLLCTAIQKHAWTFAGSGTFRVVSHRPITFEIRDNPVVRGESSAGPVCGWHAAVFERLFRTLVADDYRATETRCAAAGDGVCRFMVRRSAQPE